ncbi:MAG TPA: hypothetical protein VGP64_18235 [Polyangia bacterium]|jgi:hypothetical protein
MLLRKILGSFIVTSVIAGLVLAVTAGEARAQFTGTGGSIITGTGGTTGSSAFQQSDFFVSVQHVEQPVSLTTFELQRFFNLANCDCSRPINLFISLLSTGIAKRATAAITTGTVSVVLGQGCSSVTGLQTGTGVGACLQIASEQVLTFLSQASYTIPTDARTLSTYFNATGVIVDAGTTTGTTANGTATACTSPIGTGFTQTVNFNFNFGSGGVDLSVPLSLNVDLTPPPPPAGVKIQGGDEALVINWTGIDTALVPDLLGYQVLCSRANQYQVFNESPNDAGGTSSGPFSANFQICPATQTGTGVAGLDPTFVCSGLLSAQSTSARIEILQNNITYAASVIAIDNSGNPSPPMVGFGTPIPTLSFYDVYRSQTPQGAATGGFCALPTARPGVKATAGALGLFALGALGLAIARRRRGPR